MYPISLKHPILTGLVASATIATAGVTVIDLGGRDQPNPHVVFTGTIDAGDPAAVSLTAPIDTGGPGFNEMTSLSDGATLSWTNVAAWNTNPGTTDPGQSYFFYKPSLGATGSTFFTVTTANPGDLVSIDFVGGVERDAEIDIGGTTTVIPNTASGLAWTNVATNSAGPVTGTLNLGSDAAEANVGAMRITITPVPEPSGVALLGLSAALMAFRRRR